MPTDALLAIQSELADIKTILLVVSVFGCLVFLLVTVRKFFGIYFDYQRLTGKRFETTADDLLKQDRLSELKAHALEQLATHPNHEYAHWYLARALYLERDYEGARKEFDILEQLCPSWKAEHIDPYLQTIPNAPHVSEPTDG